MERKAVFLWIIAAGLGVLVGLVVGYFVYAMPQPPGQAYGLANWLRLYPTAGFISALIGAAAGTASLYLTRCL